MASPEIPSHNGWPDIVLGGGVFNYQYTEDPHGQHADQVLARAFSRGIRAVDTSAYYGPSEEIIGKALAKISDEHPRSTYMICTKAGRVKADEFDYRAASIRASVQRSLKRLHTDYLDVLYIHDVEFNSIEACIEAITEAFRLKDEGVVRLVGISGYPVKFLFELSCIVLEKLGRPLDVVLSYSNLCLQNTTLAKYLDRFEKEAHVAQVVNASPLSMSLLRSGPTHDFHPAPQHLKDSVSRAAQFTAQQQPAVEIADLAVRFALRAHSPTVFGLMTTLEVDSAVETYWKAHNDADLRATDEKLVKEVHSILGSDLDYVWPSGIHS